MKDASSPVQPGHLTEQAHVLVEHVDVIAARRTVRLEPELDGMSHELGVELAAVRVIAGTR